MDNFQKSGYPVFVPEDERLRCHYTKISEQPDTSGVEEGVESWKSVGEVLAGMFSDTRLITVEEYLGFPEFPPADHFTRTELATKNDEIIRFLLNHRIKISRLKDYPEREMYTFLTKDLMQQEIYDLHLKDICCNFLYEMIRPDDTAELEDSLEEFLVILLGQDWRFMNASATDDAKIDGYKLSTDKKLLRQKMNSLYKGYELDGLELMYDDGLLQETKGSVQANLVLRFQDTSVVKTLSGVKVEIQRTDNCWMVKSVSGLLEDSAV